MLSVVILQEGCRSLPGTPASPSDRYRRTLRDAGLDTTALGRDWIAAGDAALGAVVTAPTPFRASGELAASEARALAWQWTVPRGAKMSTPAWVRAPASRTAPNGLRGPSASPATGKRSEASVRWAIV